MPKNLFIRIGMMIVVATALIYVGKLVTNMIDFILPYTLGAGILAMLVGLVLEARKKQTPSLESPIETIPTTTRMREHDDTF